MNKSSHAAPKRSLSERYARYRDAEKSEKVKVKNFRETAIKLLRLLKGNVARIVIVTILTAVSAALNIIGPIYLGDIIDLINVQVQNKLATGAMDFSAIFRILSNIFLIYSVSSLCQFFINFTMAGVTQRMITGLRFQLNRKLSILPLQFFDSHNKGDLLSRLTNDIDNVNNTFQQIFIQTVTSVVTFVGVFVIMLTYNRTMTFASLAPLPIGGAIALVILNHSKRYFRQVWRYTGDVNGHIEEMFTNHRIVRVFGREQTAIDEFREINDNLYQTNRKAQFLSGLLGPLINCANNIGFVFICIVGGILIAKQGATIGTITIFMTYSKLFMQPLIDLSNIVNNMQSSLASAERVFEIIDEPAEVEETVENEITVPQGSVSFSHVSFAYTPDKPLYEDFNLEVQPGELVAIVGPTGAGKTTLVNLLMRFYDVQKGSISVDG